jgi:hypothetical protein
VFDIVEKSSKFLLEIIILVLPANKMGSDKVFLVGRRSFIHITKSKGPKIDPWGTPSFIVPHFEGNFCNYFILVFFCHIGSEPVSYCSLNVTIM